MKKQIFILALWMFVGFVLIRAIDSILSFIISLNFYLGIWFEFPIGFINYSIPILSIIIYALTTVLTLKYLNKKAVNFDLNKIEFPKVVYIIAVIIAIFLNPIKNRLSGFIGEIISSMDLNYTASEFISSYGMMHATIGLCRWAAIIILSIYFYRIYKNSEIKQ